MSAWRVIEVVATVVLLGNLLVILVIAAAVELFGHEPRLLDGTPLGSVLDDRDRARHIAQAQAASDAYLASERLSMELDYVYSLPARDPGWTP